MRLGGLVAIGLGLLLGLVACAGEDNGDIVAFCRLNEAGVGAHLAQNAGDLAQLDALQEVAPPDIREVVTTIANASREIEEIQDLQELFSRAFDLEEAVTQARQQLQSYANVYCP
ncbi:MAG: hypothetical protein OXE04_01810 [bacterium]|nr:hypothetical protein [bacterium]